MQSIYAILKLGTTDLKQEEKKLLRSIEKINNLYAVQLQLLLSLKKMEEHQFELSQKKIIKVPEDAFLNDRLVNNQVFNSISENTALSDFIENNNLDVWGEEDRIVTELLNFTKSYKKYNAYMAKPQTSFNEDKSFITSLFKDVIAPNEKVCEYLEEACISWTDDLPFANTMVLNSLERLKTGRSIHFGSIYKDEDDRAYVTELFTKTALNLSSYNEHLANKTPNWDKERIAQIDMILIKMAICEFLNFPSIPARVTINEYIEISKEYTTKQSGFFINGILDRVLKEFEAQGKLQKIGRGLL
jgi:N utilization substance protein B